MGFNRILVEIWDVIGHFLKIWDFWTSGSTRNDDMVQWFRYCLSL